MKHKKIFQNHLVLASRLRSMARALNKHNATEEDKQKAKSFENQADEHQRKSALLGKRKFIMIL